MKNLIPLITLLLTSCTYAPRTTKIDQTYNARQMAIGVTSQPNNAMVSTTILEDDEAVPSHNPAHPNSVTIGSSKNDVARIQGTPTTIADCLDEEWWWYGSSYIVFKQGAVKSWNQGGGALNVAMN